MLGTRSVLLGSLLAVSTVSCGDPTRQQPVNDLDFQVVDGDAQIGVPGEELPKPIVVRVTDDDGTPVSGVLVNFVVTAGGGHVFASAALSNAAGEARERWTLGAPGENLLEARSVDQTTGDAIVHAQIRATAVPPSPPAPSDIYVLPPYRSQFRVMGQVVEVRDFVQLSHEGWTIPDAPFSVSAGPGFLVTGTSLQADPDAGREADGMVTVSIAGASDSFRIAFLPDLSRNRWRARYSCGSASVHLPDLDSLVNVVALSDSVRQSPYQLSADDAYAGLDVVIFMRATATLYYRDGRVVHGPVPDNIKTNVTAEQLPRRMEYTRLRHGWRPAPYQVEYSSATSDGTVPPTYVGGHLCDDLFNSFTPGFLEPVE